LLGERRDLLGVLLEVAVDLEERRDEVVRVAHLRREVMSPANRGHHALQKGVADLDVAVLEDLHERCVVERLGADSRRILRKHPIGVVRSWS
jgi:hypothetical protein